jgi:hypothetical protein
VIRDIHELDRTAEHTKSLRWLLGRQAILLTNWAGSHVVAEASQPRQGVDALLVLAAGATNRRIGNTGVSNVPRPAARPDGDMEIDGEDSEDADNLDE